MSGFDGSLRIGDDDLLKIATRLPQWEWDPFWRALGIVVREVARARSDRPIAETPAPVEPVAIPVADEPAPAVVTDTSGTPPTPSGAVCPECGAVAKNGAGLSAHRRFQHRKAPKVVAPMSFEDRAKAAAQATWDERHSA